MRRRLIPDTSTSHYRYQPIPSSVHPSRLYPAPPPATHTTYLRTYYSTRSMRAAIVAVLLPLAALASPVQNIIAPLSASGESIDDSYIVVLKKDVSAQAMAMHLATVDQWHGADVSVSVVLLRTYRRAERWQQTGQPSRGLPPVRA